MLVLYNPAVINPVVSPNLLINNAGVCNPPNPHRDINYAIDNSVTEYSRLDALRMIQENAAFFRGLWGINLLPQSQHAYVYLWIIGVNAPNGEVKLFYARVTSCYQIGIKHEILMDYFGITGYYSAGEILVRENNQVQVNLFSPEYMARLGMPPYIPQRIYRDDIDKIWDVSTTFINYKKRSH